MKSNSISIKEKVVALRHSGKTYGEIQNAVGKRIPKSTLSYWCKNIPLSKDYQRRIEKITFTNIQRGRVIALVANKAKRKKYLQSIEKENKHLASILTNNMDTAKIAIAMLYLGEGSKTQRGSLMFGNSDPKIISLFLSLLRYCYAIDENKFRCTLQCRADQDIKKLERFWSKITKITLDQFYKARVDPRTIGKKSRKLNYKGVCRIDYFSAQIYTELMCVGKILTMGL